MSPMQAISVGEHNAFGVNTLGIPGTPFPLSISVVGSEHLWTVHGTAARAHDLIDVLAVNAHDRVAVLNVGQNSWLDDDHAPWPLSHIARQQDITFTAHDIRWAASPRFSPDDLLFTSWYDLHRLLDGWSTYDIEVFDLPGPVDGPGADELALIVNLHDNAVALLPRLPGSRVYYSGHDDCHLSVETTDPTLPTRLFARLLALFAGSYLLEDDTEAITVPEPAVSLVETLVRQNSHWVGTVLSAEPGRAVTLGLVPGTASGKLGDPIPRRAPHSIALDRETGAWKLFRPGELP